MWHALCFRRPSFLRALMRCIEIYDRFKRCENHYEHKIEHEGLEKCYQEIVMAAPNLSYALNVLTELPNLKKFTALTVRRIWLTALV